MQMFRSTVRHEVASSVIIRRAFTAMGASDYSENLEAEECKYSNLLQACAKTTRIDHGEAIHAIFVKESLLSSLFLRNHLLIMYAKSGHTREALQVFEEMPERNVVSWSAIMAGLVQHGSSEEALSLFQLMHRCGEKANEFTLVSALNACSLSERSAMAPQIYALIVRLGFETNVFLTNAFLTALIRQGNMVEASKLFESFPDRDTVSWNALIAGYLQYCYREVPGLWRRMNRSGVKPDNFTFSTVLTGLAALCDLQMGLQVHAQLVEYGFSDETCVGNSLVDMYLKNGRLAEGLKVFDEMPVRDVISWTQMASRCLQCGEPSKALSVIEEMKMGGLRPNKFTLATALNACANLASLEEGMKIHGLRIKLGDEVDVCVDNALLDMYAKCGCIDGAWGVFQKMSDRSVVSWTTMIKAFAQNGHAKEALEVFKRMRLEHAKPNNITFICVLYACSQGGFIDEGWQYFSLMTQEYDIEPGEDHYACMVNLLGRAGRIKEAETLILSMPFEPGVLVWQTLLGACRVHGDMETGRRAAEKALVLDKEDPSTYVLLSNIFADSSNWDGVGELRKLMDTADVKKMPGSSWMEVGVAGSG